MAIDYKSSGVDIEKGDELVDWLKSDSRARPHEDKIIDGIGGFASIFQLNFPEYKEPCLVSATDGIGTKLKLAIEMESYETLGQDLVAMCVNDLICTGAKPLFFLDYFATSKLELDQAQPFLKGLRKACDDVSMTLIGGETAEMPGLYQPRDFDCAGFAIGLVDKAKILGPHKVKEGMVALGVSSSGFHSNGYSLVRKLFSEDIKEWGARLLEPTKLYVPLVQSLLKDFDLAAVAHITGGGLNNVGRVLPDGLQLKLQTWALPDLFKEAQKRSGMSDHQMLETFNCGVGLVLFVEAGQAEAVIQSIEEQRHDVYELGRVETGSEKIIFPQGDFQ